MSSSSSYCGQEEGQKHSSPIYSVRESLYLERLKLGFHRRLKACLWWLCPKNSPIVMVAMRERRTPTCADGLHQRVLCAVMCRVRAHRNRPQPSPVSPRPSQPTAQHHHRTIRPSPQCGRRGPCREPQEAPGCAVLLDAVPRTTAPQHTQHNVCTGSNTHHT